MGSTEPSQFVDVETRVGKIGKNWGVGRDLKEGDRKFRLDQYFLELAEVVIVAVLLLDSLWIPLKPLHPWESPPSGPLICKSVPPAAGRSWCPLLNSYHQGLHFQLLRSLTCLAVLLSKV